MINKEGKLHPAFYRALKLTPEQREANLRKSPYYDLNKKYEQRTEERNAARLKEFYKAETEHQAKLIAETKAKIAEIQKAIQATDAQIASIRAKIKAAEHKTLMKNIRANAAIREFTASLKGSPVAPVAAPVAPAPTKTAADALQELINKRYRLK